MVFFRKNNSKIKINEDVINEMYDCMDKSIKMEKEYCGVLLGREIIDTLDIIVDKITQPSNDDIQRKYYYFRDSKYHQRKIREEWQKSKGTCNYIGEWHTHLENYPNPSGKDIKEWIKALKKFKYEGDTLFFIIIGMKEISIWEGNKKDLSLYKLIKQ